jgi:hypothetical protein
MRPAERVSDIARREDMRPELLYRELASGAPIIRNLLTGITSAEARSKPNPESWSVLEVVCHLYDEEREDFRQRLDIMLYRPEEQWPPIDPLGWVTRRKYNDRELAEVLDNFVAERGKSLAWLRGLSAVNWDAEYVAPFGALKAGDMLASWVAHDNLHMRQLVELRRGRVVRITEPYDVRYAGEW